MKLRITFFLTYMFLLGCAQKTTQKEIVEKETKVKLKALIIDGQNNHGVWPKTTMMMKEYIEQTGLFTIDVERMSNTYQGPHHTEVDGLNHSEITKLLKYYPTFNGTVSPQDSIIANPNFDPKFKEYDVIVSNFGWQTCDLSPEVRTSFEEYMKNGGGLVVVHAANNAWGDWAEFNKMIGVGGWGDRPLDSGNQIFYKNGVKFMEPSNGQESSHGPEVEFLMTTRESAHPIMRGLPEKWLHTKDELYDRLRGPAENITILATAYSGIEKNAQPWALENKGSGRDEPLLMTINYGKGRVFHSALGHMDYSMESVGFITTLQRGAEWAATGAVSQEVPEDFPTEAQSSSRKWTKK